MYLPRRDLKTLLHIPHVLSRIAFELVFQTLDLQLGVCITEDDALANAGFGGQDLLVSNTGLNIHSHGSHGLHHHLHHDNSQWGTDDHEMSHAESDLRNSNYLEGRRDLQLEKWLAQRTADIIARVMTDPSFAGLVRTLRVSASPHHRCDHMVFQSCKFYVLCTTPSMLTFPLLLAMLAIALPKLVNLRRVSFAGSNEVASKFAEVLAISHPYLTGLTLQCVSYFVSL